MSGGASGPEAFTLLLRLLMTHFDRVDINQFAYFWKRVMASLFLFQSGVSRVSIDGHGELARFVSGDGCGVGGGGSHGDE